MNNIQKLAGNKKYLRLSVIFISAILLFVIPTLTQLINSNIESSFRSLSVDAGTDSNIVVIGINSSDILSLGGWPIKRSYYALLINYLTKYSPDKIGLEVFLSENVSTPDMYNTLLTDEIEKAGNVVLASLAGEITYDGESFVTDNIEYPVPAASGKIKTGYINYVEDKGIVIPLKLKFNGNMISSFSEELSGQKYSGTGEIKLNLNHSWNSFRRMGLVEFFELCENDDASLRNLKGKKIIVGVTDPTIARTYSSYYDDQIPGVALHAFAVDNLLNDSGLNDQFILISIIVFLVLIITSQYLSVRNEYLKIGIMFAALLLISYMAFTAGGIQLNHSYFIVPLLLLTATELSLEFISKDRALQDSINEREILDRALSAKEDILRNLERELDVSGQDESLLEKIDNLKSEITSIRKSQADEEIPDRSEITSGINEFFGLIYKSDKIGQVVRIIEKVAPQDATVLIQGESGSGKELAANAIHTLSGRRNNKFVAVNCAALTSSLLESELFGHVKGAFTNAVADKQGMFEAADKGTIFLDEIGETDENFQVKLLRVLQSGEIQKVGSTDVKFVNVRVVAATNKDLKQLVADKKFREDLYYRLNVINVTLPPLRDRKEDVPVLANYFAEKESLKVSKAVIDVLVQHDWKGNVRELESIIKRASIFAETEKREIIKLGDLPGELSKLDKSDLENLILHSLREKEFSHSSINETAKELGNLSRTIVSENFRGIFFKQFFINRFNIAKAAADIAQTDDRKVLDKVTGKGETYLKNISKDLVKLSGSDFETIKKKFASKYKNLPTKYHRYLDDVVRHLISQMHAK